MTESLALIGVQCVGVAFYSDIGIQEQNVNTGGFLGGGGHQIAVRLLHTG